MKYFASLRKDKGYTLEDVGKKLGVGKSTISNWEHGRRKPSIENLKKIAKLFETTVDELIREG